jgi:hypothetical protein
MTKQRGSLAARSNEKAIENCSSEYFEATPYSFAERMGNRERICLPDRRRISNKTTLTQPLPSVRV